MHTQPKTQQTSDWREAEETPDGARMRTHTHPSISLLVRLCVHTEIIFKKENKKSLFLNGINHKYETRSDSRLNRVKRNDFLSKAGGRRWRYLIRF